jgi:hypothetical protein
LRGFDDDVDVFSQMISPVHGFSVFFATDQIVHHLALRAEWRMDVVSYEDRSDPESLRMERTEKDHTFI